VPPLPPVEPLVPVELVERVLVDEPSEVEFESAEPLSLELDELLPSPPLEDPSSPDPPSEVKELPPQAAPSVRRGTMRIRRGCFMTGFWRASYMPPQKAGKKSVPRNVRFGHQCQGCASK
jgi:hypothetical protein